MKCYLLGEHIKTSYQLLEIYQRRSYWEKLLRLIKFCVSLKRTSLQRLMNKFYAGAVVVTNRLGVKIIKAADRKKPMWGRRCNMRLNG